MDHYPKIHTKALLTRLHEARVTESWMVLWECVDADDVTDATPELVTSLTSRYVSDCVTWYYGEMHGIHIGCGNLSWLSSRRRRCSRRSWLLFGSGARA